MGSAISVQPLRVLIIDDDQALLRMLRLSMLSEGLEVATASDGFTGLEALARDNFDAIVLDLQMPNMDGRTLYRQMLAQGRRTPVLILSAYGAEAARRELRADAALPKPFDPDVLVETIRRIAEPAASS